MAAITDQEITLKKIAAILGIIQGVGWTVLSVICLAIYFDPIAPFVDVNSWMEVINGLINSFYFYNVDGENFEFFDPILPPNRFVVFSFLYLILDAIWVLISVKVYFTNKGNINFDLILWSATTGLVCLLDLILVAILSADFQNCKQADLNLGFFSLSTVSGFDISLIVEAVCVNSILPVLVIAAKGFALWILNAVFAVVILLLAKKVSAQPQPQYNFDPYQNNFPQQPIQPHYPRINPAQMGSTNLQSAPDNRNFGNFAQSENNWNSNQHDYYNRPDFKHQSSRYQ